ncbi:argininosuccinate synthase [Aureococcus anophagefferens]|nr:argininosuccinate synthase [Aureococcus anophagefferens]
MLALRRASVIARASAQKRCLSSVNLGDTSVSARFREPDPSKPKIVLAYSGGLDTSTQLAYLAHEKGYEVCAYIADLGQDDVVDAGAIEEIKAKAEASGAYASECVDLRREFIRDYVYECIKANCLYEGRYLLGTAMARPCIAKKQVELAWREGAST